MLETLAVEQRLRDKVVIEVAHHTSAGWQTRRVVFVEPKPKTEGEQAQGEGQGEGGAGGSSEEDEAARTQTDGEGDAVMT